MAKLTREDVLKLAKLSRLHLADDEIDSFTHEIEEILGYVEQLQEVDLDSTPATTQVTGLRNVTRKDKIVDYKTPNQELLKNAPKVLDDHIQVKRMIS